MYLDSLIDYVVRTNHENLVLLTIGSRTSLNAQLWLRKLRTSINTPECGWGAETKRAYSGSVPDPFRCGRLFCKR